jgi:hypothetical protein
MTIAAASSKNIPRVINCWIASSIYVCAQKKARREAGL